MCNRKKGLNVWTDRQAKEKMKSYKCSCRDKTIDCYNLKQYKM